MCEMKLQYLNERSALPNPKEIIVCYRTHSYATKIIIECESSLSGRAKGKMNFFLPFFPTFQNFNGH